MTDGLTLPRWDGKVKWRLRKPRPPRPGWFLRVCAVANAISFIIGSTQGQWTRLVPNLLGAGCCWYAAGCWERNDRAALVALSPLMIGLSLWSALA